MEKKNYWIVQREMKKMELCINRNGINGDYDDFDDVEQLMNFILTGVR